MQSGPRLILGSTFSFYGAALSARHAAKSAGAQALPDGQFEALTISGSLKCSAVSGKPCLIP